MKNLLEHIAEGIGIVLVVILYHRHRKISTELSAKQDNTSENQ